MKNPILVAAKVMETPHLLIVGDGATQFARAHRFPDYDPLTEKAQGKHARARAELRGQGDGDYAADAAPWHSIDWKSLCTEIVDVGLLVASRDGQAIASNRNMASALLVG
ncbi:isoaspartyl peptidase/L-asparaginase [Polyangium mundeleinium]|uniref:Isoaspartyl peptidase/L-asparaginase n=1 Tax=Polyangium mundeleinium TaxID=2995306 RepID=A0ABT5EXL6_9BACT|nr:isoaspartyl peptidase/L-asparaginase [Polyangium mundeleinium]MDC0745556.1 isoaspartyl peptidase/L-asparaginase [Polyangium mundeleinium]